jgi:RNA polymerase sigma-70 factor (sigma-E family)
MARDVDYVAFVEANWDRYLRLARLLTGDRDRGEELLQDSLVRLYVRWRRAAISGDVHAYLRRILVNSNINWWRRRRWEQLVDTAPDRADPAATDRESHEDVRRALQRLPRRQCAVVVLRYFEDLTEREVAAVLGCTVGTVKSQNSKALSKLRALLAERPDHRKVTLR